MRPDKVSKLVTIEGLGPSPALLAERESRPMADRLRDWIADKRQAADRMPRRYQSMADALARMKHPFDYDLGIGGNEKILSPG